MDVGDRYKLGDKTITVDHVRADGWILTREEGLVHSSELAVPKLFTLDNKDVFAGDRLWNTSRKCWCTVLRREEDECWHKNDTDPAGKERFTTEFSLTYSWSERA